MSSAPAPPSAPRLMPYLAPSVHARMVRVVLALALALVLGTDARAAGPPELQDPESPAASPRCVAIALIEEAGERTCSLWDVPIGAPATRKQTLGPSPWGARPLADSPQLLRWQVPPEDGEPQRRYLVRLLHLDDDTLELRELCRHEQARGLGETETHAYADTTAGILAIGMADGAVTPLPFDFELVIRHGSDWLIQTEGQLARFDAARGEIVGRYPKAAAIDRSQRRGTRWDGGRFVVRGAGYFESAQSDQPIVALPYGEPAVVLEELRVCDLETGDESTLRRRIQARGGSGIGVLANDLPTELVAGLFRYVERLPATGEHADLDAFELARDTEWVTIDVATGKELRRVAYHERAPAADPLAARRIPDYLSEAFQGMHWVDDKDIAREFLADRGIECGKVIQVCRTHDGNQLLALAGTTLYLCRLAERDARAWPAPAAWANAVSLELCVLRD